MISTHLGLFKLRGILIPCIFANFLSRVSFIPLMFTLTLVLTVFLRTPSFTRVLMAFILLRLLLRLLLLLVLLLRLLLLLLLVLLLLVLALLTPGITDFTAPHTLLACLVQ